MASAASVYIGEWVAGVKQGYGIMDDIKTGIDYFYKDNSSLITFSKYPHFNLINVLR